MATLTLIRGLPGSGKSTYAREHYRALILENDMFLETDGEYHWSPMAVQRAISIVKDMAITALENGNDVVVCNTFTKRRYIEQYRILAEKTNARFEVIRCNGDFGNIHSVPEDTLKSMKDGFEDWLGEKIVVSNSNIA